jgi:hypothetical protein
MRSVTRVGDFASWLSCELTYCACRQWNGRILREGAFMRKFLVLLLASVISASATVANTRAWKEAIVINVTETDVTGELHSPKNTMHYTIETPDTIYFADFAYKPSQQGKSSIPDIAVNVPVKIAVEGHSAYILDTAGREVKLHVKKKKAVK